MYTTTMSFLIMDVSATYNVIFGRSLLNAFRAVVSTYHNVVKFPAAGKVITVCGNLDQSRICRKHRVSKATSTPTDTTTKVNKKTLSLLIDEQIVAPTFEENAGVIEILVPGVVGRSF